MHKKKTSKTVQNRCQIIIDLDEAHGKVLTHEQSAKTNCVCMATITNTVKLYLKKGLKALLHSTAMLILIRHVGNFDGRAQKPHHRSSMQPGTGRPFPLDAPALEEQAKIVLDVPVSKDTIGRALKK